MQELKLFFFACGFVNIERIGIALAKEADVVGILQFFKAHGISPKLLVVVLNRSHVGGAAMPHLIFTVTADLLSNFRKHGEQSNGEERKGQHQRDQHVAALGIL